MQAVQDRKQDVDRRQFVGRTILGNDEQTTTTARNQANFGTVFRDRVWQGPAFGLQGKPLSAAGDENRHDVIFCRIKRLEHVGRREDGNIVLGRSATKKNRNPQF